MDIKKELPGVKENVLLKNYTTFRIGGPAKYFFTAKNKKELISAILVAKKFELPFFILGGGSNVLVADRGFRGLVIKCQIPNSKCQINSKSQIPKIKVEAGVLLSTVVLAAAKKGLTGLEWAVGIPGTVGGAIWGNAGAFGYSMADAVTKIEIVDVRELGIRNYELRDCKFGYRDSIFKQNKNLIILSALFQLKRGKKTEINKKIKEYLNYRQKTQPLNFPSAGSVFKNYELRIMNYELLKKFPELEEFNEKKQIPAAWMIEKCGLKGKTIGKAKISEKHANFIVNLGEAKAKDVKKLIDFAKKKVKKFFRITLEEEIQYLGF